MKFCFLKRENEAVGEVFCGIFFRENTRGMLLKWA